MSTLYKNFKINTLSDENPILNVAYIETYLNIGNFL
jgi:hypothetical protein